MPYLTGLIDGRHLDAIHIPTHRCDCGTHPDVDMIEISTIQERIARLRRYLWGRAERRPGCTCTSPPRPLLGEDFLTRGQIGDPW